MRTGMIILGVVMLVLITSGCVTQSETLYVCPTGEKVSDSSLCPKATLPPVTTQAPESMLKDVGYCLTQNREIIKDHNTGYGHKDGESDYWVRPKIWVGYYGNEPLLGVNLLVKLTDKADSKRCEKTISFHPKEGDQNWPDCWSFECETMTFITSDDESSFHKDLKYEVTAHLGNEQKLIWSTERLGSVVVRE